MSIKSYRELKVWTKAMDLVSESYKLAKLHPKTEIFGLTSQLQRAAVSIPANIAEGHGREHLGDYLHHLSIANGSLMELETHQLLSVKLSYVPVEQVEPVLRLASEIGRMLAGLTKSLRDCA